MIDQTTLLLSSARFASAVARLCLGPLLPLLSMNLHFPDSSKPALLSAYSSGYILTQVGGGYLADRYGYAIVVAGTMCLSALILEFVATYATTVGVWTNAFFLLGLAAGPLFPAGSTAISSNVPSSRRAASAAIIDAAASGGTTVAAMSPLFAEFLGSWRPVFHATAASLALISFAVFTATPPSRIRKGKRGAMAELESKDKTKSLAVSMTVLLQPTCLCAYCCHAVDNFSKYSINSWAATMLANKHGASPSTIGAILGAQEAAGVVSKALIGVWFTSESSPLKSRGEASMAAFCLQGLILYAAFQLDNPYGAGACFLVSAVSAGAHSIGYRTLYFEVSPCHAGSISGLGNTVASFASILGPTIIGSSIQRSEAKDPSSWWLVGMWMLLVNLVGAVAATLVVIWT
jgi:MFS family permease